MLARHGSVRGISVFCDIPDIVRMHLLPTHHTAYVCKNHQPFGALGHRPAPHKSPKPCRFRPACTERAGIPEPTKTKTGPPPPIKTEAPSSVQLLNFVYRITLDRRYVYRPLRPKCLANYWKPHPPRSDEAPISRFLQTQEPS